jgi:predicted ATPase
MKIKVAKNSVANRSWLNVLTELGYTNFKAFSHLDLDIRPITVLLGPNNSGKSSILAGPKLLTQTTESFDANVTLLLNGIFGDYGTYRDVVFQNLRSRSIKIEMALRYSRETFFESGSHEKNKSPQVTSTLHLKYKYRSKLKQIVLSEVEVTSNSVCLLKTKYSEISERPVVTYLGGAPVPPQSRTSISRRLRLQHFMPRGIVLMFNNKATKPSFKTKSERHMRNLQRSGGAFFRFFDGLEYVGAIRAAPARTFLFSGETRARVGASGEHAINIMVMDSLKSAARTNRIRQRVVSWLKRAGIAGDLKVHSLSDRHYEIHLKHPVTGEYSNFADVGYGNSQVIPVLVAGYNLRRGGTLLVEQPEIHLHPRAQAELGDFFRNLYERRVQSLVETHSEHLVLRLQQYVASGVIPAKDIVFYYVHAKGHSKKAVKMTLDASGQFEQEWPEGFFPERLEEAKKLARARLSDLKG